MLVLVWQFLVFCGVCFAYIPAHLNQSFGSSLLAIGVILLIITAIVSGWLADTKVGRSRVVQTGLFITWLGVVFITASRIPVHTLSVQTTSSAVNDTLIAVQYRRTGFNCESPIIALCEIISESQKLKAQRKHFVIAKDSYTCRQSVLFNSQSHL